MNILVQMGNLGSSVLLNLINPLAQTDSAENIMLVCRRPGPVIPKVKYYCPPIITTRFSLLAVFYEFITLFILAIFRRPDFLLGYLLFPHGLLTFIVAKLTGRPVILSLIAGPVELYAIGSPLGVEFTKPIPWLGRIFLQMLKNCHAIVTTGSFTKDFLIKQGIKRDIIFPMINPPASSMVYAADIHKEYDVVLVGRLTSVKHVEVLLRAAAKAKEHHRDIKVCIVGDGPRKPELIKLTVELQLNDNVEFVGWQKDVGHYYNRSKIFVLTSEREGFPNVFLEAMMYGLPSIVSNCGDITDLARDNYTCILIQRYSDYFGFADAITRLLADDVLYHRLSKNSLHTMGCLSPQEITQQWELILDRGIQKLNVKHGGVKRNLY